MISVFEAEARENDDVLRELQKLLDKGHMPQPVHDAGFRLLQRLRANTRVLIAGPESAGREFLSNALCARALPGTEVHAVASLTMFDPEAADICIWCTSEFGAEEAQVWCDVPDILKDHSFLAPIATPLTEETRMGDTQLAFLEGVAAEEFYGLFPVVVTPHPDATQMDMIVALLTELEVMVSWEQALDTDNALAFIDVYGGENTQPVADLLLPLGTEARPDTDELRELAGAALAALRSHTDTLVADFAGDDPVDLAEILTRCITAAEEMADALNAPAFSAGECSEINLLREDAQTAADQILLLSLEGGLEPTITAVTTLLQMRRALEVQHAA